VNTDEASKRLHGTEAHRRRVIIRDDFDIAPPEYATFAMGYFCAAASVIGARYGLLLLRL
jgi:hypothetical protein